MSFRFSRAIWHSSATSIPYLRSSRRRALAHRHRPSGGPPAGLGLHMPLPEPHLKLLVSNSCRMRRSTVRSVCSRSTVSDFWSFECHGLHGIELKMFYIVYSNCTYIHALILQFLGETNIFLVLCIPKRSMGLPYMPLTPLAPPLAVSRHSSPQLSRLG